MLAALRAGLDTKGEQVGDGQVVLEGVAQRHLGVNGIGVVPAHALPGEVAGGPPAR